MALSWEAAIKILVCTDPEPHPFVTATKSYCAIIPGDTNRPGALVRAKALQSQTWVCWMLREQLVCFLSSGPNRRWQPTIEPPKLRRRARNHLFEPKSLSAILGKASGFALRWASY
jgi:hypothetical protein